MALIANHHRVRVLVCGSGSGAHVLAAVISARPNVELCVLTLNAVRAQEWNNAMSWHRLTLSAAAGSVAMIANPFTVTGDAASAARGADIVIISMPAFMHQTYLTALAPHLEEGCIIVGVPGQSGFDFDIRQSLGPRLSTSVVINFESLPWICRTDEFARSATILGRKERLVGAMRGDVRRARVEDPLAHLQYLLGAPPQLIVTGHPLGITLRSPNAYSHPPIMFSRWRGWNGSAVDHPPLFYQGVDEETADLLDRVSKEVVEISRAIMADHPEVDLSQVIPMYDWDLGCYGGDIDDKTNLMTALRTNCGYKGIEHPMLRVRGGYVPDFSHRFMAEDVPFGLVVVRGIAELAGVSTPAIDEVLLWCQERMGKEYLVRSRLAGRDVDSTRCPQRYGFTMRDILVS
jgi:hypothetical protein